LCFLGDALPAPPLLAHGLYKRGNGFVTTPLLTALWCRCGVAGLPLAQLAQRKMAPLLKQTCAAALVSCHLGEGHYLIHSQGEEPKNNDPEFVLGLGIMALDFSVDEFAFSDAVFDDFLKDLDEDNRTQKNVDLTFKGKSMNLHEFNLSRADVFFCHAWAVHLAFGDLVPSAPIAPKPKQAPSLAPTMVNAPYQSAYGQSQFPSSNAPQLYYPTPMTSYPSFMATGHISPPLPDNLDDYLVHQIQQDDEREREMLAALDVDLLSPTSGFMAQPSPGAASASPLVMYPPDPSSDSSVVSSQTNSHKRKNVPRSPKPQHYQPPPNGSGPNQNHAEEYGTYHNQDGMQMYTAPNGDTFFNPFAASVAPELLAQYDRSYDGFAQAAPKIQRVSHPLLNFPHQLFEQFNGGDIKEVRSLLAQHTAVNCQLTTPSLGAHHYVEGQEYVQDFFEAMAEVHPDAVWIAKKVRYHPPRPVTLPLYDYHKKRQQQLQQQQQQQQNNHSRSVSSSGYGGRQVPTQIVGGFSDDKGSVSPPSPSHSGPMDISVVSNEDVFDGTTTSMMTHGGATLPMIVTPSSSSTATGDQHGSQQQQQPPVVPQEAMLSSIACRIYFAGTRVTPNLNNVDLLLEQTQCHNEYLFHAPGRSIVDELEHIEHMTPPEIDAMRCLEASTPSLAVFGKGTMTLYMSMESEEIVWMDMQWKVTSFRAADV
jgi:hypothetical protein